MSLPSPSSSSPRPREWERRHLLEGWGLLFLFSLLGITLEFFLAFKMQSYVRVENETRRLLWRLAHAHGALFGLLHIALSLTLNKLPFHWFPQPTGLISGLMTAAGLLVPGGFFLSGLSAQSGDPGAEIALVPAGATALLVALALLLVGLFRTPQAPSDGTTHIVADHPSDQSSESSSRSFLDSTE